MRAKNSFLKLRAEQCYHVEIHVLPKTKYYNLYLYNNIQHN